MAAPLHSERLAQVFWIVSCANTLFILALIGMNRADASSYGGLIELFFLGSLVVLGAITLVVALTRGNAAYWIGLVVFICPLLIFGTMLLVALGHAMGGFYG